MLITSQGLKDLFTGYKTAFQNAFAGKDALWPRVATMVPSTKSEEKYGWLGKFPRLRKWLGDRQIKSLQSHDWSIRNEKFESTISVERDLIQDDSYGIYSPMFAEMGDAAKTHPDELIFPLMTAGFTSVCYDGQFFFDTDHPVGNEDTGVSSVSNMQAGGGNPWFLLDTSRPIKPFIFQKRRDYDFRSITDHESEHVFMRDEYVYGVDARVNVGYALWQLAFGSKATLDATNFDAAIASMMSTKSDEGTPLGVMPNLLVVGSSNRAAAKALIEKEKLAGGEDNTNYKAVEVLVVPWLT